MSAEDVGMLGPKLSKPMLNADNLPDVGNNHCAISIALHY